MSIETAIQAALGSINSFHITDQELFSRIGLPLEMESLVAGESVPTAINRSMVLAIQNGIFSSEPDINRPASKRMEQAKRVLGGYIRKNHQIEIGNNSVRSKIRQGIFSARGR